MKFQPIPAQKGDDDVQTPPELCEKIVRHFWPTGLILEPCSGDENFWRALSEHGGRVGQMSMAFGPRVSVKWCEIKAGRDFFDWTEKVDWIVTNPPWSKIRPFLAHSMKLADNVVFLITVNHVFTKARIRVAREAGFGLKEILLVDTPAKETGWPQQGFQVGAVHWRRGYVGPVVITHG